VSTLYFLTVTVHLLAAFLWLGGAFFLAVVGAPVLRSVEPPALRAHLFRRIGERFRVVGWVSVGVLLLTGSFALHLRGLLRWEILSDPLFWNSGFGRALGWKLLAVTAIIAGSAFHDFLIGPRASRLDPTSPRAAAIRRYSAYSARVTAIVGLLLIAAAVRLARGG
jgi:copper resistance protein D